MNPSTIAGDELARYLSALDRKVNTLSSQLESFLEHWSQAPSANPIPIPRKAKDHKQIIPNVSDSLLHALSAPSSTYPSAEHMNSGSKPVQNEEASRCLEVGQRLRLAATGLPEPST